MLTKEQIQEVKSRPGYFMIEDRGNIEVAMIEGNVEVLPDNIRKNVLSAGDVIYRLAVKGTLSQLELDELNKNPVKAKINWWNTGKVMNEDQYLDYKFGAQIHTERINRIDTIMNQIADNSYRFKRYEVVGDGLGDGTWLSENFTP